jgi:diguanylate cyclase (GGDEF)-like protein/PAS domain S-box-containing protein
MFIKDDNFMGDKSIHHKAEQTPFPHTSISSDDIDSLSPEKAKEMLKDVLKHQAELEKKIKSENKQDNTTHNDSDADFCRSFFNLTSLATYIYELKEDNRLVLVQCNPASEQMTGLDSALLVGLTIEESFPSLVATNIPDMYRSIARGELESQLYEEHYVDERFSGWYALRAFRMRENTVGVEVIDISKIKLAEDERKKGIDDLERMFNLSAYMVCIASLEGYFRKISPAFTETLGFSEKEFLAKPFVEFVHPDDRESTIDKMEPLARGMPVIRFQNRYICKDGSYKWLEWTARSFVSGGDIYAIAYDITEGKLAIDRLKLAANVFTHARESIFITDARGTIIDVNDTFTAITKYNREEAIGQNPRILQSGRQTPEFYDDMWQVIQTNGFWSGELWNRRKDGEIYPEMLSISSVKDATGQISNYLAFSTDITLMKEHQGELERIAHYDMLTNLPNRVLLADLLSQAMLQCRPHEQSLAVVLLDLDGFKAVNDAYGHGVGDELLIALSLRMKEALSEGDSLARIGGDEFVAILTDLTTIEDCELVLERFLLATSEPITVGDVIITVSASIGVTLYPEDNVDTDKLMRHADQAMYVAKQSGKNRYHLFDIAQDDAVKVQRQRLLAIRSALDNHQFVLYYQPKVNMKTGAVVGVEALIRWQNPERGQLIPIEFLPAIEKSPMMIELGEWVIDTALTQISQWQKMGLNLPISTSVNIAAVQLQQPDFTKRLRALLAVHPDVEPSYLELEVLETSALDDVQHVSKIIRDCMALGVKFALDDFGTGYSSLTYLRRLPACLIKIDQSFVRDMLSDAGDLAIVEGVIALAKLFKREVIAEGVETIQHGTAILQLGCHLAQGYGIAKPMPASDIPAWISDWKPDLSWQS